MSLTSSAIRNVPYFSSDSITSTTGSGAGSPTPSPTPDAETPGFLETGSSSKDPGFYMLRKDSERRITLVKVFNDDQDEVS